MRYGKASQIGVAIRKTRDTTDMIDTVDGWADLVSIVELDMLRLLCQCTFTMVKSQFGSILFVRLMRPSGTIQSLTGGGLG